MTMSSRRALDAALARDEAFRLLLLEVGVLLPRLVADPTGGAVDDVDATDAEATPTVLT